MVVLFALSLSLSLSRVCSLSSCSVTVSFPEQRKTMIVPLPLSTRSDDDSSQDDDDHYSRDDDSSLASCTDPVCCPPPAPPPASASASKPVPPRSLEPEDIELPVIGSVRQRRNDDDSIVPLLIVGAGPHALALAARLSEPRPAALYTDLEHARLSWLQRDELDRRRPNRRPLRRSLPPLDDDDDDNNNNKKNQKKKVVKGDWHRRKLVPQDKVTLAIPQKGFKVVDASSNEWLARWRSYFRGLAIDTLRSPMIFHPSPADVDALVAYAKRTGREPELVEIPNVVGKELSKHQRKKKL